MNVARFQSSLLCVAVTAALAACGGGGGGDSAPAATTTTGTNTTATTTTGQTLTANTGTSSGAASNTTGNVQVGLPAIVEVPAANRVVTSVPTATYAGQASTVYSSINDWRDQMRFEEENGGTRLGVGLLTQVPALDALATTLLTSQPNLASPTASASDRAAAIAAAQAAMVTAGYQTAYVVTGLTTNTLGVTPGNFCAKSMFSSLPGVELTTAGTRDLGMYVPETAGNLCFVLTGLAQTATWQLPPTGSSSVYPFPGKQLTLPNYYGDWAALGFTSQPGHAVFASVASNDALPIALAGVGTGAAIPTSEITVLEFSLKVKNGAAVPARIFTQAGVVAGSGVTLNTASGLLFPTSIMMVPESPLTGATVYTATFRATVRGRSVTRTWDFTSA